MPIVPNSQPRSHSSLLCNSWYSRSKPRETGRYNSGKRQKETCVSVTIEEYTIRSRGPGRCHGHRSGFCSDNSDSDLILILLPTPAPVPALTQIWRPQSQKMVTTKGPSVTSTIPHTNTRNLEPRLLLYSNTGANRATCTTHQQAQPTQRPRSST